MEGRTRTPLALAAVLALAACGAEPAPPASPVAEVRDVLALLRTLDEVPGAGGLADKMRETEYTDEVAVLVPGEALVFEGLDVPAGAELSFSVHVSVVDAAPPTAVSVALEARSGDGEAASAEEQVSLVGPPTQHWFEHRWTPAVAGRIARLSLRFELDVEAARVMLLRPRLSWTRAVPVARDGPRRVLLVTMDTLRADHLGCYGHPLGPSPAIDAFASDAVRFESCYSASNVTNPSHASLFTSLHLKDHEVRDNLTRFSADVPNVVTALQDRGFRTAAFVSSHNFKPGATGFDELFDDFFESRVSQRRAEDVHVDLLPWLTEHRDEDFFAWVHYYDVHAPYDPPHPFNAAFPYEGAGEDPATEWPKPPWHSAHKDLDFARAQYLGEVAYLDARFAELLDHLRALGLYERTLVVVTSDHGESLGEHGIACMHKGLHETTTHVPLVIRVPGGPRGVVGGLASLLDVGPTLFDWLDLPFPGPPRGRSLRAEMERGAAIDRERVFSESDHGTQVALRTAEHRAILGLADRELTPRVEVERGRLELYATARDPGEVRDLAGARPVLERDYRAALEAFLEDAMALGAAPVLDEAFREEMAGLGYTR